MATHRLARTFAAELRALLLLANARRMPRGEPRWTSARVGEALEIDASLVRRWLRGERVPSLQSGYVDALAAVLQLDEAQRRALETAQIQALRSKSGREPQAASAARADPQFGERSDELAATRERPAEQPVDMNEQWLTLAEVRARQALHVHATRLSEIQQRYEAERAQLAVAERAARNVANSMRRLLTDTGTGLVQAAVRALRELGFTVDAAQTAAGLSDQLRISLPTDSETWEALAFVRGYRRSLPIADLVSLGAAHGLFRGAFGRSPNAMWYVVNQFAKSDPDTRPQPLRDQLEGAGALLDISGVIIDTRDLFRCWNAVDSGDLSAEEARALLVSAVGQFAYPSILRT